MRGGILKIRSHHVLPIEGAGPTNPPHLIRPLPARATRAPRPSRTGLYAPLAQWLKRQPQEIVYAIVDCLDDRSLCALAAASPWRDAQTIAFAIEAVSRKRFLGPALGPVPNTHRTHPALAPTLGAWLDPDASAAVGSVYTGALRRRVSVQRRLSPVPHDERMEGMASRTRAADNADWPSTEEHDALGATFDLMMPLRREMGARTPGWARLWAEDVDTDSREVILKKMAKRSVRGLMLLNLAGPRLRESIWGKTATAAALVSFGVPNQARRFWRQAIDLSTRSGFDYAPFGRIRQSGSLRNMRCKSDVLDLAAQVAVVMGDTITLDMALKQRRTPQIRRALEENARFLVRRALFAGETQAVGKVLRWHTEPLALDLWGAYLARANLRLTMLENINAADIGLDASMLDDERDGLRGCIKIVFGHCARRMQTQGMVATEVALYENILEKGAADTPMLQALARSSAEFFESLSLSGATPSAD